MRDDSFHNEKRERHKTYRTVPIKPPPPAFLFTTKITKGTKLIASCLSNRRPLRFFFYNENHERHKTYRTVPIKPPPLAFLFTTKITKDCRGFQHRVAKSLV
jgi:hypothetical protein